MRRRNKSFLYQQNGVSANDSKDAVIYNMAGQQVGKSAKGIVIKNGKKYINAQGK